MLPALVIPYVASKRNLAGTPDRWVLGQEFEGWIEFKGVRTKVTNIQAYMMRRMNSIQPGTAFIWRMLDDTGLNVLIQYCVSSSTLIEDLAQVSDSSFFDLAPKLLEETTKCQATLR